jgi:hypothetical protein
MQINVWRIAKATPDPVVLVTLDRAGQLILVLAEAHMLDQVVPAMRGLAVVRTLDQEEVHMQGQVVQHILVLAEAHMLVQVGRAMQVPAGLVTLDRVGAHMSVRAAAAGAQVCASHGYLKCA